jgi:hypothetical protein
MLWKLQIGVLHCHPERIESGRISRSVSTRRRERRANWNTEHHRYRLVPEQLLTSCSKRPEQNCLAGLFSTSNDGVLAAQANPTQSAFDL